MINFTLYRDKKTLNELIELRDEIDSNRHKFHRINDRLTFWFYVKVLSIFIVIYKFIISKENSNG